MFSVFLLHLFKNIDFKNIYYMSISNQLLNFRITANGRLNENIRSLKDVIMSSANEVFYLSNNCSYGFFFMSYYISQIYQYHIK